MFNRFPIMKNQMKIISLSQNMHHLLESTVLWSYDHELKLKTGLNNIAAMFSGVPPIHNHEGHLLLTEQSIIITGDSDIIISLNDIEQIYVGFDENYRRNFVKNFGAFCQPLRIKANNGISVTTIYLILDYTYFSNGKNQTLFNMLQELLS